MTLTHLDIARRFLGQKERPGHLDNPFIVACLSLVGYPDAHDETAWCAAFMAGYTWVLGIKPPGVTAAARSWLRVGQPIALDAASSAHVDIVILTRGSSPQPGPDVIAAPGHVGLVHGLDHEFVYVLGGNQADAVTVAPFPRSRVLGVRRLA